MIGLLQRVTQASVTIDNDRVASIDAGLLVLIGMEKNDTQNHAKGLLDKIINYRIFADDKGKMNHSLKETAGDLLLVPQFTLAANTNKGLRPSFSNSLPPDRARTLFDYFIEYARARHERTFVGVFGADMQVSLINDGPVTFCLQE